MKEKHQRNINVCLQAFTNGSAEAGLLPNDAVGSKGELAVLLEGRGGRIFHGRPFRMDLDRPAA